MHAAASTSASHGRSSRLLPANSSSTAGGCTTSSTGGSFIPSVAALIASREKKALRVLRRRSADRCSSLPFVFGRKEVLRNVDAFFLQVAHCTRMERQE